MNPRIYDVNGTERDWVWLTAKYGRLEHRRGAGFPRFELARIEETIGPASLKVKLEAKDGSPIGALVALTYPDLGTPWDQLPLITGDPPKSPWSKRAVLQFTDGSTGLTGFGLGGDSWIKDKAAGGPYHVWPYHTAFYADCLSWIGWLGGTDHAGPCSLVFQLTMSGGTIDPEPEPEPTGDLVASVNALTVQVKRLADYLTRP